MKPIKYEMEFYQVVKDFEENFDLSDANSKNLDELRKILFSEAMRSLGLKN